MNIWSKKRWIATLALLPALAAPALVAAQNGSTDKTGGPVRTANAIRPFTTAALVAAQRAGRPILVDVHADWCPTCRAQAPVIASLVADPANANVVFLRLNFDTQQRERAALRATSQSTLIAFRGRRETGRLQGVTDAGQIARLVASTRS
jgi:thiol-disulfide isomerase/thioredoxin